MVYLTMHSFYLRLYGVKHMVTANSDSERGNPLLPYEILFLISIQGSFIICIMMSSDRQDNTYHGLCYTSHGVHC